jgi:hypothetical protein
VIKSFSKLAVVLSIIFSGITSCYGVTPTELFNDAQRAFSLGHWQESRDMFDRFLETWPDHKLKFEALYKRTLSDTRNENEETKRLKSKKLEEWQKNLEILKDEMPNRDYAEIEIALKSESFSHKDWSSSDFSTISPDRLLHMINRGFAPSPFEYPMRTLEWIKDWRNGFKQSVKPALEAQLSYLQALALWQILLSPLPKQNNNSILKTWGYWPVHKAFEEALDRGFSKGSPSLKRELALLGYHYEYFSHNFLSSKNEEPLRNKWYTYLSARGINPREAWCPR